MLQHDVAVNESAHSNSSFFPSRTSLKFVMPLCQMQRPLRSTVDGQISTDRQTDRQMDRQTDGRRAGGQTDGRAGGRAGRQAGRL